MPSAGDGAAREVRRVPLGTALWTTGLNQPGRSAALNDWGEDWPLRLLTDTRRSIQKRSGCRHEIGRAQGLSQRRARAKDRCCR